jgi:hypothetical protein
MTTTIMVTNFGPETVEVEVTGSVGRNILCPQRSQNFLLYQGQEVHVTEIVNALSGVAAIAGHTVKEVEESRASIDAAAMGEAFATDAEIAAAKAIREKNNG